MFTLILKDGRRISAERAEDVSTFWDKESANREAAQRNVKKIRERFGNFSQKKA